MVVLGRYKRFPITPSIIRIDNKEERGRRLDVLGKGGGLYGSSVGGSPEKRREPLEEVA